MSKNLWLVGGTRHTTFHIVLAFVKEVNDRAERKMEMTGKLEGSHYAAMQEILAEIETEFRDE